MFPLPRQDVIFAWAAQVSLAQLGTRLTAYTDTKASITTFRLVAQKSQSKALRNLPEEVHELIASEVREPVFEREIKIWVKRSGCLNHFCSMPYKECEDEETYDRHLKDIEDWSNILTSLDGESKFAKRVRIFARDFGIRPYFLVDRLYDPGMHSCHDTEAYLILPVFQDYLHSTAGDKVIGNCLKHAVDLSLLTPMSEDQLQTFATAVRILKLHGYHEYEDESMYLAEGFGFDDSNRVLEKDVNIGKKAAGKDTALRGCQDSAAIAIAHVWRAPGNMF